MAPAEVGECRFDIRMDGGGGCGGEPVNPDDDAEPLESVVTSPPHQVDGGANRQFTGRQCLFR